MLMLIQSVAETNSIDIIPLVIFIVLIIFTIVFLIVKHKKYKLIISEISRRLPEIENAVSVSDALLVISDLTALAKDDAYFLNIVKSLGYYVDGKFNAKFIHPNIKRDDV